MTFITLYPSPGATEIISPVLTFTNVLKVKRNGNNYDIIYSGTPTGRQVLFNTSAGSLLFNIPFEDETIYALYN